MDFTDITITNILASGTGFAVRNDDLTSVFISSKVAAQVTLNVGDTMSAILAPNHREHDRTPWQALKFEQGVPPAASTQDLLYARVRAELERGEATADELAHDMGASVQDVVDVLLRMRARGEIETQTLYALVEGAE